MLPFDRDDAKEERERESGATLLYVIVIVICRNYICNY